MVCSPSALAASSRCRPSTSTKRVPSALTRIGAFRPLSRMLAAISSTLTAWEQRYVASLWRLSGAV